MQRCSAHVMIQLPNGHSCVSYVLDAIETSDANLCAAMANVNDDDGPNGKRGNFEAAVAYLLPRDPIATRKIEAKSGKQSLVEISEVQTEVASFGTKSGIEKTGVHLR